MIGENSSNKVTGSAFVHIDWVEFTYLGHTVGGNNYPVHFHKLGDMSSSSSYFSHNSLHDNDVNNLVVHNTSGLVIDSNVMHKTRGWHFWTQDDDNSSTPYWNTIDNEITNNLAIRAEDNHAGTAPMGEADNAVCFYLRHFKNTFTGNHAVGSDYHGIYIDTKQYAQAYPWVLPHDFTHPFSGNVAHSCAGHGIWLGNFTEFQRQAAATTGSALFSDCTVYKNNAFGIFCQAFGTVFWDLLSAEVVEGFHPLCRIGQAL